MRLFLFCVRLFTAALLSAACLARAAVPAPAPTPVSAPAVLAHDALLASLARDLSVHFNLEGDLQLELQRSWTPPADLASVWNVEILDFHCRFLANQVPSGEATLVLHAALWRDAWVVRQPLVVGAAFEPAMLETRRVDLFRDRDAVPVGSTSDHGYVFARAVSAGRLLTWHDLARRPLVRRGQLVEVSAIEGMLNITMKALAMENGAEGDTVTVRNPESHKEFSALVIDENRVQVRF
jgi:flagella basal body P-ring formation protein FlgA